jgi:hypothetical protein
VANTGTTPKSQLWHRRYRHGNRADHKSEILSDMPLEYYEGVSEGVRDCGFDCFPDYYP